MLKAETKKEFEQKNTERRRERTSNAGPKLTEENEGNEEDRLKAELRAEIKITITSKIKI